MNTTGMLWVSGLVLLIGVTACGSNNNNGSGDASSTNTPMTPNPAGGEGTAGGCAIGETNCGGECRSGICDIVDDSSSNVYRMTLSKDKIYWTASSSGASKSKVLSVPINGGNLTTIVESKTTAISIASDDTGVYWTDRGVVPGNGTNGSVSVLQPGHDMPVTLATGLSDPSAIALDGTNIYWLADFGHSIRTMNKSGGGLTIVSSANADFQSGIAVDASSVYWAGHDGVMKVAKTGGMPTTLFSSQSIGYRDIAVDGTSVYWTDQDKGTVTKMPKEGGVATTLASGQPAPRRIAIDELNLYWLNDDIHLNETKTIMKMPKSGGVPVILVSDPFCVPQDLKVDSATLYFGCSETNIHKIAKDAT